MEFALVEGKRHQPSHGLKGVCQFCGQAMVSKCGEMIMWHWAHRGRKRCDPWHENEGPWHRAWKALFPVEHHEQVRFDSTGEKHIADVLLPSGLVVELQHSQISLDEMRSREGFYRYMVWIVDATPLMKNITVFGPLPDPSLPAVADLRFIPAQPSWRDHQLKLRVSYENVTFYRKSKMEGDTIVMDGSDSMGLDFASTFVGHRLTLWTRPREVWLNTTRPTFLDFGNGTVGRLMFYPPAEDLVLCLQVMTKSALVRELLAASPHF